MITPPIAAAGVRDPGAVREPIAVEREAEGGLAHHHRRRRVAGIALCSDPSEVAPATRRPRMDLHAKVAVPARLRAWPLARARKNTIQKRPGRPEREAAGQRDERGGNRRRPDRGERPGAHAHDLAVAQTTPVCVVLKRIRAPHDARVVRGHHERGEPLAESLVSADAEAVALGRGVAAGRALGHQRVGISGDPARLAV